MLFRYTFLFISFFSLQNSFAQPNDINQAYNEQNSQTMAAYKQGNYKEALVFANEAIQIAKGYDTLYPQALNFAAILHERLGDYDKAEPLYLEALNFTQKVYGTQSTPYAFMCNNTAVLYKKKGELEKAEDLFKKALEIRRGINGATSELFASTLNNIAGLYLARQRYKEALPILQECLSIRFNNEGKETTKYATTVNNLAVVHKNLGNFEQAEKLYKESRFLREKLYGKEHPIVATTLHNLALLYNKMYQYEAAEKILLECIELRKKTLGLRHPEYLGSLFSLAQQYQQAANYPKAIALFNDILTVQTEVLGPSHPRTLASLNSLSEIYLNTGQIDLALQLTNQALIFNSKLTVDSLQVLTGILESTQQKKYRYPTVAITSLIRLANIYNALYNENKTMEALKTSLQILEQLSVYIQKVQGDFSTKQDKLNVLTNSSLVSAQAIRLTAKLQQLLPKENYQDRAIAFAEHNKSAILSTALASQNALNFGEVPDSLAKVERQIKKELDQLGKKILNANSQKDKKLLSEANSQTILLQLHLDSLNQWLKEKYPKYNQLKNEIPTLSSKQVQTELLDSKTALLEYFIYEDNAYLILISAKQTQLYPLEFEKGALKAAVKDFRKSLSDYPFIFENKNKAYQLYTQKAAYFYTKLIAPALKELEGIEHLIIVPDSDLGHIPFEALLSNASAQTKHIDYTSLPYLLNDFRISYSYSAALLLENKNSLQGNKEGILAFAASYNPQDSSLTKDRSAFHQRLRKVLQELPAAKQEVEAIKDILPSGTYRFGLDANEAYFKKEAPQFAVLHLAMHGLLDAQNPLRSALAFTENGDSLDDNFLEAHEISHLQLNNDLVVLSACETGYGKFEQGEGVMSLARSFMYAGVPSLVVGLWQVNDASTAIVMKYFYDNLALGKTKDEALRQAKFQYIKDAKNMAAHPAFWSAFIQIGDSSPIQIKASSYGLWVIIGLVALAFLGFVFLKKKRNA